MEYISVKNWQKFQHYRDRSPPWIKLHRELLRDYSFMCLQDASKLQLMLLWLLASQLDNKIPADMDYIKHQIGVKGNVCLKELIDKGFVIDASNTLAERKQSAIGETETETETEERGIRNLAEIEKVELNGKFEKWFSEKAPHVDRFSLRDELVGYCKSKNKKYSDYWATLQNWARKREREWQEKHPQRKTNNNLELQKQIMEGL